jgi:hypothetical protein
MTSEANFVGRDDSTKSNDLTVISQGSAINSDPSPAPASQPERPTPPPAARLTANMEVNVNSQYGSGAARVLFFALDSQRTTYFDMMLSELRSGDHSNAYLSYQDFNTANDLITELTLSVISLADHNFWAASHKGSKATYASEEDTRKQHKDDRYRDFLRNAARVDPDSADE